MRLESGACTIPGAYVGPAVATTAVGPAPTGRTRITYITDPICSACWIPEPAWSALIARYRDQLEIRHVYGGLLPSWDGFQGGAAGIRRPEDVAHHWDEFAERSGQPINTSVWSNDPIRSSYPPSIATAAVSLLAPEAEELYLRRLREELFLNGRNIARSDLLESLVFELGLDAAAYWPWLSRLLRARAARGACPGA